MFLLVMLMLEEVAHVNPERENDVLFLLVGQR
jgi:hypothetical protein